MAEGGSNPERACDRCRERRVKCDKTHPACTRCQKLGKPCPGYAKKRKFVDEGVLLRRKFERHDGTDGDEHLSGWTLDRSDRKAILPLQPADELNLNASFEKASAGISPSVAAKPPVSARSATSLKIDPISADAFPAPSTLDDGQMVDQFIGEIMSDNTFDPSWFDLDPTEYYNMSGNSCGFLPNAPNIVDEVDKADYMSLSTKPSASLALNTTDDQNDWNMWASESQLNTSFRISDEREHEMAFLIRHFSESIGPWMDLFDCERHFAQLVPLKALRDVLLKNAMAAVAAKQLGCIKGSKPSVNQTQKPAAMELIEFEDDIDWFYKAANYYDKAIMCSRAYLAALTGSVTAPPSPSLTTSLSVADTDDLLLAVSIFSLYEYLDNADFGWIQHLTGLKSILSVMNPPQTVTRPLDQVALGRRASFWNFARADYQAAYINKTTTLLDTDNLAIWQDSGLQIQANGTLYSDSEALANDRGALSSTNQLVAHTLLWILLQTMNFLFTTYSDPAQKQTQWQRLTRLLDVWQSARPRAFQPCASVRHRVAKSHKVAVTKSDFNELFFSIPICAATVQLYHFARLLLHLNRPDGLSEAAKGQDEKRVNDDDVSVHAYTIIGIALGRPQPAVRVEMLLPLYLAGSCLQADHERQIVVDVMMAIGKDTGCVAGGRIKELTNAWSWPSKQKLVV